MVEFTCFDLKTGDGSKYGRIGMILFINNFPLRIDLSFLLSSVLLLSLKARVVFELSSWLVDRTSQKLTFVHKIRPFSKS
jgi:hypothetical protein